jgi:ribonuclease Y
MDPIAIVLAIAGLAAGYGGASYVTKQKLGDFEKRSKESADKAEKEAADILLKAKSEAAKTLEETRADEKKRRDEFAKTEQRLLAREESLDKKLDEIDRRTEKVRTEETEIEKLKTTIHEIRAKQQEALEKIAKLKKDEARTKLMEMTEKDIRQDLTGLVAKLQQDAKEHAEDDARVILTQAMERLSSEVTAEKTVVAVPLPDEMKGRIIGKEGRNIQTIQRLTGVDVLVDETPGVVVLSCFDPIRRQVARLVMETLIKDGRVHPGRIEEVVEKATKEIDKEIERAAEEAMREVGVPAVPPEIKRLLGELKFRTSYGQNVLKHSTEMAHLAGMIAGEIGADVLLCKTAALLHDIGKAVTHKIEGKHHHIGAELARKAGMSEAVCHAIEAHHDDIEATTPEAMVIRVVDALSAARPGARNVSAEDFVKRMQDLENVANGFEGIEKSFAISAGREIRVFVRPQEIDDLTAIKLARDIAYKIEATLQYPGTIKVTAIRETRAIEYAK